MHFFLYQIAARAVAIYILYDCVRTVRQALIEGSIACYANDAVNVLLGSWKWVVKRDASPIQFWMQVSFQGIASVGCVAVLIFGWHSYL